MNEKYITISAISFVLAFITSIWPRQCSDKFKKILERKGDDPNRQIKFKEMKELDPKLYKQLVTGVIIWIPFGASFFVFGVLAVLNR